MTPISTLELLIQVVVLSLVAGGVSTLASAIYRMRFRESLPEAASLISGLGVIAVIMNSRLVFVQFIGSGREEVVTLPFALENFAVFGAAAMAALGGHSLGERIARSDRISIPVLQPSLSPIVRATGRYITLTLPEEIDDIEGYDPVSTEAKAAIAGRRMDFPRGLTVDELADQVASRLTEKHDIGYVDVDVGADGEVGYLAVGQRPAGLGPTLPPGMVAMALRADPAFSASPGDAIEIWEGGDEPEPIGMAELRASTDDVVTVACDGSLGERIDTSRTYRIVTLPADARPDREFAAILRHGSETMGIVDVGEESGLVGTTIAALDVTVIAIQRGERIITLPDPEEAIAGDDRLFILARPDRLRTLESQDAIERVTAAELEAAAEAHWANGRAGRRTSDPEKHQ